MISSRDGANGDGEIPLRSHNLRMARRQTRGYPLNGYPLIYSPQPAKDMSGTTEDEQSASMMMRWTVGPVRAGSRQWGRAGAGVLRELA